MKKIVFLCALFYILAPGISGAQDLFVRKEGTQKPAPETIDRRLGITPKAIEPKQDAPPASPSEFAKRYYQNCAAKSYALLNDEAIKSLCACLSVSLQDKLDINEINLLVQPTAEGQAMRIKMMQTVYAPCMKYPVYDLIKGECLQRESVKKSLGNAYQVCNCTADTMSRYVDSRNQEILQTTLRQNPGSIEPLSDYLQSDYFNRMAQTYMTQCIQIHEFGVR